MTSNGANSFEMKVSITVEVDTDSRLDLVEAIHKELKASASAMSIKIISIDKHDDGLRRVATKMETVPDWEKLKTHLSSRMIAELEPTFSEKSSTSEEYESEDSNVIHLRAS